MKRILSTAGWLVIAAALTMGTIACSSDDSIGEVRQPQGVKTYTMTVEASKDDDAVTRALAFGSDGKLNATWTAGDEVTVYNVTKGADLGGKLTAQSDGANTKLEGTLAGDIDATDVLTLKFLSPDYDGQDGTLEYIAAHCDYAEATVTVANTDGGNITTTGGADFQNRQAIVRFTLKDKASGNAFNANTLRVDADGTTINVTPVAATDVLYVAVPGIDSKTVALYATAEATATDVYAYTKENVTFANGQYYAIGVKVEFSELATPLTLQPTEDGTLSFRNKAAGPVTYRVNGGTAQTIAAGETGEIPVSTGDKVAFYGDNNKYGAAAESNSSNFSGPRFMAYGNVMSLISSTGFPTAVTLTNTNIVAFAYLFSNSGVDVNLSTSLCLPATTLESSCYKSMFQGCTNLKTAPELSATTLESSCYESMFQGCTSLKTAPRLPATTLASSCYKSMFQGCTSLTKTIAIDATTLAQRCCSSMFEGCTSLKKQPTLNAKKMAAYCYQEMFKGCTSLTEGDVNRLVTKLAESCCSSMYEGCTSLTKATLPNAKVLENYCYYAMFKGCTSLEKAPVIYATTCYNKTRCCMNMFNGCSSLNNIKIYVTDTGTECTKGWVTRVSRNGSFVTDDKSIWTTGSDGIPSGWTVTEF